MLDIIVANDQNLVVDVLTALVGGMIEKDALFVELKELGVRLDFDDYWPIRYPLL